jgi:glycosyltransferase involved in cell wall biosynthesis
VRLIIWHGYLLADTGSNIYTRHIARAWSRLGHDVTVLSQEPHPERYDLGERVRVVRPDIGTLLPVFVIDRYEGLEARHVADFTPAELDRYVDANVRALTAEIARGEPPGLVLANHAIRGGPVAAGAHRATGASYAVKVHGSELEYAIRGRPALADMARGALDGARAVYTGSQHIVDVTLELLGPGPYRDRLAVVPPGVDLELFRPEGGSRSRLDELLRRPGQPAHAERRPDADAADRISKVGRFVLYFGKLLRQKGVQILLEAWRDVAPSHPGHTLVVVGFGSDRAELEGMAGERVVFTGAMDHEELACLVPLADAVVVPSVLPEAFGMVAAEAAACGVVPIVSDHSGLAEVAAGLGAAARTFDGTPARLAARIDEILLLDDTERRSLGQAGRRAVADRWSWERVAGELIAGASPSNRTTTVDRL